MTTKEVFGTKEWASKNRNIFLGCEHDCLYCYAKGNAVRFKRCLPEEWKKERLNHKTYTATAKKVVGRIMYPSTHDITPRLLHYHLFYIAQLLDAGNELLIVTKPHLQCVKAMCKAFCEYKDKITFRFTIGSMASSILKFWEPNAPGLGERIESLQYAFYSGFKTSVSCEPILDACPDALVNIVQMWVNDTIWLGKMNNAKARLKLNGNDDADTMSVLEDMNSIHTDEFFKHLYECLKFNPLIRWKDSIKKIVGIESPEESGLDI